MNKFFVLFAAVMILSMDNSFAAGIGFHKDNLYVGPTVGLNQYFTGGTLGFGGRGEYGLMDNVDIGSFKGSLGLGADMFYSSFTENYWSTYEWKYTYFSFLVFASYHFSPKAALDPYISAGLGYHSISVTDSYAGTGTGYSYGYGSGISTTGEIGIHYYISDGLSIRASLGYPVLLSAGVDFNLGTMGWSAKK